MDWFKINKLNQIIVLFTQWQGTPGLGIGSGLTCVLEFNQRMLIWPWCWWSFAAGRGCLLAQWIALEDGQSEVVKWVAKWRCNSRGWLQNHAHGRAPRDKTDNWICSHTQGTPETARQGAQCRWGTGTRASPVAWWSPRLPLDDQGLQVRLCG